MPLADALEYLAQTYQVTINMRDIPEEQRMRAASAAGNRQTLQETLATLLAAAELDYSLQHEVVVVAPRDQAAPHRAGERAFRETLPNLEWLRVDW